MAEIDILADPRLAKMRTWLLAEIRKVAVKGFNEGYTAAIDMLAEPVCATWLASVSDLSEDRAALLMLELRELLTQAGEQLRSPEVSE